MRFSRLLLAFASLLAVALVTLFPRALIYAKSTLNLLLSLSESDLPGPPNSALRAFDISPDGKTFAAEYATAEGMRSDGTRIAAIRVAEWAIVTDKIGAQQVVEGPAPGRELSPNPQYTANIRFTPDGKKLIAQTGPRIRVLDASNLTTIYSISSSEVSSSPKEGIAIRRFAVSGDSRRLAVLSSPATAPCTPTNLRLFNLETGAKVAEWGVGESCPYSIFLSTDGAQILLSGMLSQTPPFARSDVLLVDSPTGKLLRDFDVGVGTHGLDFMAGMAQFLGNDLFIVGASVSMNTPADVPQAKLKIFDLHTGQLVNELTYPHYGVRGYFEVAARASLVAVLAGGPKKPEDILRDDDTQGFERILLFRLSNKEPFYVSPDRGPGQPITHYSLPALPLHISSDGKIITIFDHGTVKVYALNVN